MEELRMPSTLNIILNKFFFYLINNLNYNTSYRIYLINHTVSLASDSPLFNQNIGTSFVAFKGCIRAMINIKMIKKIYHYLNCLLMTLLKVEVG